MPCAFNSVRAASRSSFFCRKKLRILRRMFCTFSFIRVTQSKNCPTFSLSHVTEALIPPTIPPNTVLKKPPTAMPTVFSTVQVFVAAQPTTLKMPLNIVTMPSPTGPRYLIRKSPTALKVFVVKLPIAETTACTFGPIFRKKSTILPPTNFSISHTVEPSSFTVSIVLQKARLTLSQFATINATPLPTTSTTAAITAATGAVIPPSTPRTAGPIAAIFAPIAPSVGSNALNAAPIAGPIFARAGKIAPIFRRLSKLGTFPTRLLIVVGNPLRRAVRTVSALAPSAGRRGLKPRRFGNPSGSPQLDPTADMPA